MGELFDRLVTKLLGFFFRKRAKAIVFAMEEAPGIEFKQEGPFYDMVASFMVATASCPAIFNRDNPMNLTEDHFIAIEGIVVPGRHIRPMQAFAQVHAGHFTMGKYLETCCSMLANTAYESVKDQNDHSPEFEFFRHVRNAASHRNRFAFTPREPARPASWRSAVFDHTTLGDMNPQQGKKCFGEVLGVIDIVDLLWDIEQKVALKPGTGAA